VINDAIFIETITYLVELMPTQRKISDNAVMMQWQTFPAKAKVDLTRESMIYAAGQRMLDPEPFQEVPLHLSLLRYLYPLENNRGAVDRGLRSDLAERMKRPEVFHDPQPVRHEQKSAHELRRIAPSGYWTPDMMSDAEKQNHLAAIKKQVEELDLDPKSDPLTIQQLIEGKKWFKDALKGYWTLKADAGGIAKGWVARNRRESLRLIHEAMGLEVPTEEQQEQVTARAAFKDGREQRAWMLAELQRQRESDQGGFGGPLVVEAPPAIEELEPVAAEMTVTVEVAAPSEPPLLSAGIGEVEAW
jgi:hypothetical protein